MCAVPGFALDSKSELVVFTITKGESPMWQKLKPYRESIRASGQGKGRRYYEWDYTHEDIEVYDSKGRHLGSLDPITGELYKPPVPGRTIKDKLR